MADAEEGAREIESGADNLNNDGPLKEFVATDGGGLMPQGYAESGLLRALRRFSSIPAS